MHEAIAAASPMRRFELQDFPVAVAQAGVFVRPASASGRDSCGDSPMTPTHECMIFGLAVTDDSGEALITTVARRCFFCSLLTRAAAHHDFIFSKMLNSFVRLPTLTMHVEFTQHSATVFYGTVV